MKSNWTQLLRGAASVALMMLACAGAQAQLPPPPSTLKPEETALVLVDFQGNFTSPGGTLYEKFKPEVERTKMLDKTVELVKQARAKGVWIIHATEGYTDDYRELDWSNPGGFHRSHLARQAWKIGSQGSAYYKPLLPGAGDRDLFLPPRIHVSAFAGTSLNEILRSKGIKNVAVAGFTTDVCVYGTVTGAYDLGYHVYALREAMLGFFPDTSQQMLNSLYPLWSVVMDNRPWLDMIKN